MNATGAAHAPTLLVTKRWYCPECKKEGTTTGPVKGTPMHTCPKLRFLTAPMLPYGTKAKMEVRERDDYVGKETVQLDPERKRPVQSLITVRDNGQDAIVYAPVARLRGE